MLGYVREIYPDIHKPSEKLDAVTPINKKKTFRFVEPIISSSTSQKQLEPGTSQGSNNSAAPSFSSSVDLKFSKSSCGPELQCMTHATSCSGPELQCMTHATSCSGLVPNPIQLKPCIPPPRDDGDRLFQPMFDKYFNPPTIAVSSFPDVVAPTAVDLADLPVSTSIDQDAPSTSIQLTQDQEHSPIISQGFEESPKNHIFMMIHFMNLFMKIQLLRDSH
nr:hypothetical protein [Tanacetum cinerariifolium]